MHYLFEGDIGPVPVLVERTGTWTVSSDDPPAAERPRVRHARGYEDFVVFASGTRTDVRDLFDLWAFAHFIRAHRDALNDDPDLLLSAVVFLGNVCIANHPECFWTGARGYLAVESEQHIVEDEQGLRLEPEEQRSLGVGVTVPSLLAADEARFREFASVVDSWRPGAPMRSDRRPAPDAQGEPSSE